MENILFLNNEEAIKGDVTQLSPNAIQIITGEPVNTSGFNLTTDEGEVYGAYEDYTTLYEIIENSRLFHLSKPK